MYTWDVQYSPANGGRFYVTTHRALPAGTRGAMQHDPTAGVCMFDAGGRLLRKITGDGRDRLYHPNMLCVVP